MAANTGYATYQAASILLSLENRFRSSLCIGIDIISDIDIMKFKIASLEFTKNRTGTLSLGFERTAFQSKITHFKYMILRSLAKEAKVNIICSPLKSNDRIRFTCPRNLRI